MKIHLLSDVHLESGPYSLPDDLDCDVIVAAGDIGVGTQGVEWLKTLDKPVIYVLGNHEYWSTKDDSVDMFDLLAQVRAVADGSNVHVLENDAVIIGSVRFLGGTLWTDFGGAHPSLLDEANVFMNDYRAIYCPSFYADKSNLEELICEAEEYCLNKRVRDRNTFFERLKSLYIEPGKFHPLVAYILHRRTVRWLNEQISSYEEEQPFIGKTVVVSHHHPSYESLHRTGVRKDWLPLIGEVRAGGREPNGELYKVAAYASEVRLNNWRYPAVENGRQPYLSTVAAWMCGHLHHHLDYLHEGIRITCNPRGRHIRPLTSERAEVFLLFGYSVSPEEIEESQRYSRDHPFYGDGVDFDNRFVVDLDDGLAPVFRAEINAVMPALQSLHAEIAAFSQNLTMVEPTIVLALRESIQVRAKQFYNIEGKLREMLEHNLGKMQLNIGPRAQFYVQPFVGDPDFNQNFASGRFANLSEQIASLLAEQANLIEKYKALPSYLDQCGYKFASMSVFADDPS